MHVLLRTRKPSSQSREQDDHGPQAAQPPLTVCEEVPPLRRRSSTRAGGMERAGLSHRGRPAAPMAAQRPPAFFQTARPFSAPSSICSHPRPPPRAITQSLGRRVESREAQGCTISVTGSGAVCRAGSGLHSPPAKLQAVGIRQGRATCEAEALLLPRPSLGHVHGQPRRPRCVAPDFGAALGVACLELLWDGSQCCFRASKPRPALSSGPTSLPFGSRSKHPAPTSTLPRPHHSAAWAGVAILTGPTPRLHAATTVAAALAPGAPRCPEDGHWARRVLVTESEGKRGRCHHSRERAPASLTRAHWDCETGKNERPPDHPENPGHLFGHLESLGLRGWLVSETSIHTLAHRSSRLLPTQMRPPWRGAGLLQLRWRTWNPIPQDVLHRAHDDHGVHAPFLVGPEGTETNDPLTLVSQN